jgi:acyl-CoA thioesterase FadM
MNLIWRFLWVIIFSRFAKTMNFFDVNTTSFRVLPTDIDLLMHMNNGRYLSLMDLARIDFMIRCKVFPILAKNSIYPVIASEMIRFRKSLDLFQRFDISTQLLGWDDKFFYVRQYFKRGNEIYAFGLVKACFLQKSSGLRTPKQILDLISIDQASPALPAWVNNWQLADQAFYNDAVRKNNVL